MKKIGIVSAKRTPIGAFQGKLSNFSTIILGSHVIKGLVAENKDIEISEVIMGCVLQAGLGQSPARQALIHAGLSYNTPGSTINKVCGSGMQTIIYAFDQLVNGYNKYVIAGGMESMSNAPYLMPKAREGYRIGHAKIIDHIMLDGLEDAYNRQTNGDNSVMGLLAEGVAKSLNITRQDQEDYVLHTYETAKKTIGNNPEIIPMQALYKGEMSVLSYDEPLDKVKPEKFSKLKPVFSPDGSITAALASPLADGAAGLILSNIPDCNPLAYILGHTSYSIQPEKFTQAPVGAIENLLSKLGWSAKDVDLWEVNEAFATVPIIAMRHFNIPREKMNVKGGACVLGHPIGTSGARIVVTLVHAMKERNCKRGIAAICIGGGEACAIALELNDEYKPL